VERLTQSTRSPAASSIHHDDTHQLTAATYTTTAGPTTPPANRVLHLRRHGNRDGRLDEHSGTDTVYSPTGHVTHIQATPRNPNPERHISRRGNDHAWDFHKQPDRSGPRKTRRRGRLKNGSIRLRRLDHKIWKEVTDALGTRTELRTTNGHEERNGRAGDSDWNPTFDGSVEKSHRYSTPRTSTRSSPTSKVTSRPPRQRPLARYPTQLPPSADVAEHDTSPAPSPHDRQPHCPMTVSGTAFSETNAAVDTLYTTDAKWDTTSDLQNQTTSPLVYDRQPGMD